MAHFFILLFSFASLFADSKMLGGYSDFMSEPVFDSQLILDRLMRSEQNSQSQVYKNLINHYSGYYGLDASLVAAIIKVESNFDSKAVSATDALGLMQVKLDQAVADVYKSMYGRYDLPRREQLFEPRMNISIGSAYLYLVANKYFKEIKDPKTKEYCLIAAYNAGAGTVLRTFHDDKLIAQNIINTYTPDEVLKKLKVELASEQGKRYIYKVIEAKKALEKEYQKTRPESMVFLQ